MDALDGAPIPYERQASPHTNRMCGAASLSMVYRSFGTPFTQDEIWPRISKPNRFGTTASTTHLMARDALSRGFAAVVTQARQPLQTLRLCREQDIRVILNHRLKADSPAGHFTVLVDIDGEDVVLHDPLFGPRQRLKHAQLLELWQPRFANAEITGNILIAITAREADMPPCPLCGETLPSDVACPRCTRPVPLQPAAATGCVSARCAARMWNYVCCPFCDHTWTFGMPSREPTPAAPALGESPPSFDHVFSEMDRFCRHVLALPALASRPDLREQVDFILASKEKLSLAQREDLERRGEYMAQLERLREASQQREEHLRMAREDITKPASTPADGNALGQALLRDLGLEQPRRPRRRS